MKRCLLALICCATPLLAQAAIYKSVDENGHITYSNTPLKGAKSKVVVLEPLPTMDPPSHRPEKSDGNQANIGGGGAPSQSNFPSVDNKTQQRRDDKRRDILEEELANEQELLREAYKKLDTAQNTPHVFRNADGSVRRNVAAHEGGVKSAQETVDLHRGNIDALKIELSKIR